MKEPLKMYPALECAYEKANVFSKLVFSWCWTFFLSNYNKDLEVNRLYKCPKADHSDTLGDKVERQWEKQLGKRKTGATPSLLIALVTVFGPWYLLLGLLLIFVQATLLVQTLLMGWMVERLGKLSETEDSGALMAEVYWYAAGICIAQGVQSLGMNPYYFETGRTGMRIRIACCHLIYKKALRLSPGAFELTTVGQIVNLLSNDVNRFDLFPMWPFYAIVGPLSTVAVSWILWKDLGWTCLAGIAILLLYIPLQAVMGKAFSKLRTKTATLTDERVRLMNEFIPAMRVIKMYTWEQPFAKLIDLARQREVAKIRASALLRGVNLGLFFVSAKVILFVMFVLFVINDGHLTPQTVFVAMSLINQLRLNMTLFFPYAISTGAEAYISVRRIQKFLLLPELELPSNLINGLFSNKSSESQVAANNITAKWSTQTKTVTLDQLSFQVNPGQLMVIVGSVGSGKSSVLMSILGEIPVVSGNVEVKGRIAYACQEPWTFAGSVRDNILFGSPFDSKKYERVLHVCALERDMKLFPFGDKTVVGERGVSLSGGQRARINLARALYYEADVYLLDDPLSAVDASVAKHIFEKSIQDYLRKKIVILVTHQLQFIKAADQILVLKSGASISYGNYSQLLTQGIDFIKFSGIEMTDEKTEPKKKLSLRRQTSSSSEVTFDSLGSAVSLTSSLHYDDKQNPLAQKGSVVEEEGPKSREMEETSGTSASLRAYWVYVRSGGGWVLLPAITVAMVLTQFLFTVNDYWLSLWTNTEEQAYLRDHNETIPNKPVATSFVDDFTTHDNILIYTAQVVVLFVLAIFRTVLFFIMCMRSSVKLHDNLFKSVVRAPIAFFDNNPIGVLLNRCSRDMGIIDDVLPPTAFDAIGILTNDIGLAILIAYINYWVVIPTFLLLFLFYFVRKLYMSTARGVKKLEGITRSPVFSHMSNSLYGLTTIRAFGAQKRFAKQFDDYQDGHTSAWFMYMASSRWFIIILDWLCVGYVTGVTVALTLNVDSTNGSAVGLAITSAIMLSGGFQWGIRQSTEVETQMTSVERVDEYSKLPSEGELEAPPGRKPPKSWPNNGQIEFKDMSLQYYEDEPPVLKHLTFTVKAKEKIGVVGRTGAGKSSIIGALFRMTESTGAIVIDGIDTKSIGLHDLRKKLAIIPQEPILFSGSVRRNLDPFDEQSDQILWKALDEVQLKEVVTALKGGLDADLTEGGHNFSVGQRQLMCLARAIIRQNKILVLDEATANVDPRTDNLIQQTIREVFADCTIITIAHRLHTVMDSDKVLVLDAGQVVEFDEPHTLLQNESGLFYSMAEATGKDMVRNLSKMAKLAFEARRSGSAVTKHQLGNALREIVLEVNQESKDLAMGSLNETDIEAENTKF